MSSRGVTRRGARANHSPSSALEGSGDSALPVLGPDAKLGEKVSRPLQVYPRHIGKPSQHAIDIGIDTCTLANARQGQPACFNGMQVMQCTCDGEEKGALEGVAEEEGGWGSGACVVCSVGVGNKEHGREAGSNLTLPVFPPILSADLGIWRLRGAPLVGIRHGRDLGNNKVGRGGYGCELRSMLPKLSLPWVGGGVANPPAEAPGMRG